MKSIPQDVSLSTKRRNPHLYNKAMYFGGDYIPPDPPKPTKRIRQSTKPLMNKLENLAVFRLRAAHPSHSFECQSIRFMLGNGIWYKPDAVCFTLLSCWEIKGPHSFRGGMENLKVAAHKYPLFHWYLMWEENDIWQQQLVLP